MELRRALAGADDLVLLYAMPANQIDEKARRYIAETGLARDVRFLADPDSRTIDALGLRRSETEPIAAGVPHPTTYLIDRQGRVRFADVREDYTRWLDPALLSQALSPLR